MAIPSTNTNPDLNPQPKPKSWLDYVPALSDDPCHPTQIALRTYVLSLALSLGPSLIPFFTFSLFPNDKSKSARLAGTTAQWSALRRVLKRELGHDGFAFAITLVVGGGAALRYLWDVVDGSNPTWASNDQNGGFSSMTKRGRDNRRNEITKRGTTHGLMGSGRDCLRSWALNLSSEQKTFFANIVASSIGISLLQAGRNKSQLRAAAISPEKKAIKVSPTLDLTLLLLVRALDSLTQRIIRKRTRPEMGRKASQLHLTVDPLFIKDRLEKEQRKRNAVIRERLSSQIDALTFWACSARIMWCFFYESRRLPRSYVKWINALANVDPRLLEALRHLRSGQWSYINCPPTYINILKDYASDLGLPSSWGDPTVLPAHGGPLATATWEKLGVARRSGVGGLPCQVVHGTVGTSFGLSHSCLANTGLRGFKAFVEAIAIYVPAHFLPVLLTRPRTLLRPAHLFSTFLGALRSAAFLSTFISSYWLAVCFTRSLVLARIFPFISHDYWDGPFGCMLAGSLVCGSSIWIEKGRRRGEMALYVMPKALRTCLPSAWMRMGNKRARTVERLVAIISMSVLLTAAIHHPDSLRGLSRWTLSFVINGPNAGFWKRKRRDLSAPATPTPSLHATFANPSVEHTRTTTPTPENARYPNETDLTP